MEVQPIVGILNTLVIGEKQDEDDKRGQIVLEEPCIDTDDHFSGEHINAFLG